MFFILGCGGDSTAQPPDECGVINGPGAIFDCGCDELPICGSEPCCNCDGKVEDCLGECDGNAIVDECGGCEGSGLDQDEDDICDDVDDCIGEIDACSECNGPGIPVNECDCNGNIIDQCGVCGGSDGADFLECYDCVSSNEASCCNGSIIPNNSFTILSTGELIYHSAGLNISGFQFTLEPNNISINSINEMITAYSEYEFTVDYDDNDGDYIVLGFSLTGKSIDAGCGTLLQIDTNVPVTGVHGSAWYGGNENLVELPMEWVTPPN